MIKIEKIEDYDLKDEVAFLDKLIWESPITLNEDDSLQCEEGKLRSYEDIVEIFKTYFEQFSLRELHYALTKLIGTYRINAVYCGDVESVTFFPLNPLYTGYNCLFVVVGDEVYANLRGVLTDWSGYRLGHREKVDAIYRDLGVAMPKGHKLPPIKKKVETELSDLPDFSVPRPFVSDAGGSIIGRRNSATSWTNLVGEQIVTTRRSAIIDLPASATVPNVTTSNIRGGVHIDYTPSIQREQETRDGAGAAVNAAERREELANSRRSFAASWGSRMGIIDRMRNNRD